jgi:hypothetical protein
MVSLLVLAVLMAIVAQIAISTGTDARVTRNVVTETHMELAVESALLQVADQLVQDAGASEEAGGGAGGALGAGGLGGLGGATGGGESGPVDSRQDDWAWPARTEEVNEVALRIFVQDEDSKLNLLTMLDPDEERAELAFERVVRVLDFCREGTRADIDESEAEQMALEMREFMTRRSVQDLPRATQLTFDEEQPDLGLPLNLRDFLVLPSLEPDHFRDFRDTEGIAVPSIGSFVTVWSAVETLDDRLERLRAANPEVTSPEEGAGSEAPGSVPQEPERNDRGFVVNVNTAPRAVLEALFDDRDVERRFWFRVLEYRNEPDEDGEGEELEPVPDEFGEERVVPRIFDSLDELAEVDGWIDLPQASRERVLEALTVESRVFSVFLVARRSTASSAGGGYDRDATLEAEERGDQLVLAVRSTVWRRQGDEGPEIVPLERWERLDYVPIEVLDFPDGER